MMQLKLEYIGLTIAMIAIIILAIAGINNRTNAGASGKKIYKQVLVPLLIWFALVAGIASTGFFQNYELPPRILFTIIDPFAFTFFFIRKNRNAKWLMAMPAVWLIAAQSFRILVELIIYHTYLEGIGPIEATFLGYNYELYVGISALIVAALYHRKIISTQLAIAWNILGLGFLGIIIFIFVSGTFFPAVWGSETPLVSMEFPQFPYLLLPCFLMPLAVFMHFLSITQLRKKLKA